MTVSFFIPGTPRTKGSIRSFGKHGFVPANPKLQAYESDVRLFASQEWKGEPTTGAVELWIVWEFPRPKSHYKGGRIGGELKATAPARHRQKPDHDKLLRAVLDGLTGVVYVDDAQVDKSHPWKKWSTRSGATVTIATDGGAS